METPHIRNILRAIESDLADIPTSIQEISRDWDSYSEGHNCAEIRKIATILGTNAGLLHALMDRVGV